MIMSENIIKDGKGTGNGAQVDDHGRLFVKSNHVSHMSHHATYHKNAYIKEYNTTLADANETITALLYNNSSATDLEIYWLNITSDSNVTISIYIGGESFVSGGNQLTAVNTNTGTNVQSSAAVLYEGGSSADLVVTGDTNEIDGAFIGAYDKERIDYEGGIVITYKKSLSIHAEGAASDKIKISIAFAEHAAGTKL